MWKPGAVAGGLKWNVEYCTSYCLSIFNWSMLLLVLCQPYSPILHLSVHNCAPMFHLETECETMSWNTQLP